MVKGTTTIVLTTKMAIIIVMVTTIKMVKVTIVHNKGNMVKTVLITTTLGKGQQMINNNVHLATDQTLTLNQHKNLALTAKISAQLSTMLNQLSLKAKHVILQTKRKTTLILKKNAVIQNMICLNAV